jgi:(2Fe-2S) ferredoxin
VGNSPAAAAEVPGWGLNLDTVHTIRVRPFRLSRWSENKFQPQNANPEDRPLPVFERHVFVCHNSRPAGAPRPSCTADGKSELHTQLQQLTKEAGMAGKVRINKSGCLDQCEHGPTVVVYPEAVWYGHVKPEDAAEIVNEHLIGGKPVERLRLADECINTKNCPHRQ